MLFRSGAVALAIGCAPAQAADPLTLILLRLLRDKIITSGVESAVEGASRSNVVAPRAPPGGADFSATFGLSDAQLRLLIDEGFVHLTSSQRNEVYVSVRRIIADPKNAAEVPAIIADLAIKASAVRQAHEQINALSFERKRQIAQEARAEYEKMPLESREQMASVLRQRLVPLPTDLNDMILAEFDRAQAAVAPSSPTQVTPSPPPVATVTDTVTTPAVPAGPAESTTAN